MSIAQHLCEPDAGMAESAPAYEPAPVWRDIESGGLPASELVAPYRVPGAAWRESSA